MISRATLALIVMIFCAAAAVGDAIGIGVGHVSPVDMAINVAIAAMAGRYWKAHRA